MSRVFFIAEAGVNHNGSLEAAKRLVEVAAEAGADAVKFQTFNPTKLVSKLAEKAQYQKTNTGNAESQLEMLRKLELSKEAHHVLIEHCQKHSIEFLSSPFDLDSIDLLARDLGLKRLKIPSGEIVNGPYLLKLARTERQAILSTGMSTLAEVEDALGVLAFGYLGKTEAPNHAAFKAAFASSAGQAALREKLTLLHCTTDYPARPEDMNLRAMETLRSSFGLPVGLSDHSLGTALTIAAAALGASVIEKHFTLDRGLPGPDHRASLEPNELKALLVAIREVERAMGDGKKVPTTAELQNKGAVRRSLVAARSIKKGERFSEDNLTTKRPGNGVPAMRYWDYLGRASTQDYEADDLISLHDESPLQ